MGIDFSNTNLDEQFKTDSGLEENGVWFHTSITTKFLCRRFGGQNTPKIKAISAKYYKPHAKLIEMNAMSEELQKELTVKCFVEACLVGWEGVKVGDQEIPFSFENAVGLLIALPALADTLVKYTTDMDNYKVVLGNS